MKRDRLPELISEIKEELGFLEDLIGEIRETFSSLPKSAKRRRIYEESLALKLHNFYTGCERIFQVIAEDINGGVPRSPDWHKRLLRCMSLEIEGLRPPVLTKDTVRALEEFLAFRHVVRNIYGFEIDSQKLEGLTGKICGTFERFKKEIDAFLGFLRKMNRREN